MCRDPTSQHPGLGPGLHSGVHVWLNTRPPVGSDLNVIGANSIDQKKSLKIVCFGFMLLRYYM